MTENAPVPQTDDVLDDPLATILAIVEFQRRIQSDPDSVTDEEILKEYGEEVDAKTVRDLARHSTFNRTAKNTRASAREKLRRRLTWLSAALDDVDGAIDAVLNAPGRTNRQADLEEIKKAIVTFRASSHLISHQEVDSAQDLESLFERIFSKPPLDWSELEKTDAAKDVEHRTAPEADQ
ncbi:hypothetical protein [Neoroseomonas soli]|uniref:Uncharacterized protein n=1 Tax=Neoroseomonas soli TaxID=1081025 RepID=A0A9X9WTN3_9PROT|nr:hypothetical protein [Neoroseomonas soli]MBR0670512.1 hypothetical protein [Neoroseomonas soli]